MHNLNAAKCYNLNAKSVSQSVQNSNWVLVYIQVQSQPDSICKVGCQGDVHPGGLVLGPFPMCVW